MADDSDIDARRAQIEFFKQREDEIKAESRQSLKPLSELLGMNVTVDDLTPHLAELLVSDMADALVRARNEELAEKYCLRFRAWEQANRRLRQLNTRHAKTLDAQLTDAERTEWEAAWSLDNDCQEDFERVSAEAMALLDSMEENSGP
jgi:hypothetical protein